MVNLLIINPGLKHLVFALFEKFTEKLIKILSVFEIFPENVGHVKSHFHR